MSRRLRSLLGLLVLALAAVIGAGCGHGGGRTSATATTDPSALLHETFAGTRPMRSATVDARIVLGASALPGLGGPLDVHLTGPFTSLGKGRLPRFDYTASLQGSGPSVLAGATWTGRDGFAS